jgi:hypothetical protein
MAEAEEMLKGYHALFTPLLAAESNVNTAIRICAG